MTIKNGRWVDECDNTINTTELNGHELVAFMGKVTSVYGQDVTHDRIDILHHVMGMDKTEEKTLSCVLNNGLLKRFRL